LFTESQIKKVACKYGLRFLKTDMYRGNIDPYAIIKIKEFESKENIHEFGQGRWSKIIKYKILAPKSSFELKVKPKDPLLFACLGEYNGEKMYYLIHKWGKDLNIGRRIVNSFKINKWTMTLFYSCVTAITMYITLKYNIMWFGKSNLAFTLIPAWIAVVIFGGCALNHLFASRGNENDCSNESKWNSGFKRN
jgi:hypothetical protein